MDLFDILGVDISDEELEDFGETEYILDRIAKELNVQFNTRKQLLLKTLYAFVANSSTLDDLDCFSMFGTNSFNLVWERVCADVLDNQLQKPIGGLRLPVPLAEQYRAKRHKKLIELIDKPVWIGEDPDKGAFSKTAEDTLIPDLVTIVNIDGEYQFIIFDAKYYNLQLEPNKKLRGQPGIESITKQYLYQLAYKPFVDAHGITNVKNCFLMPTAGDTVIVKGKVSLAMLSNLNLQDIQIRLVPAKLMYRHYLENTKLDVGALRL
ncbi:MAG: LlaJI family restriction endonuclease [Oscillospiraceae bacterium]